MQSNRRFLKFLPIVVVLAIILTACVRPRPGGDDDAVADEVTTDDSARTGVVDSAIEEESSPADSDGAEEEVSSSEAGAEEETEEAAEVVDETSEESEAEESTTEDTASEEATAEEPAGEESVTEESAADEEVGEETATEETAAEEPATEETSTEETTTEETATEESTEDESTTVIHTVVYGENLYRIGLTYGVSWVTVAEANGLSNANQIFAGQELIIPGQEKPATEDPPSEEPPAAEPEEPMFSDYTVKVGDNLYRIGLTLDVSWVEIAEANGIVNPNQIYPGQVLKIPSSAPGPAPEFTHIVQFGENLYEISLIYGVQWLPIAQANNVNPPYIIYTGQTLVIPGG
jgi:LysM repeat protein